MWFGLIFGDARYATICDAWTVYFYATLCLWGIFIFVENGFET